MIKALFLSILCGCLAAPAAAETPRPLPPGLDAYVEKMREQWSIPGVAIAIVPEDGPPVIRTYGKRQWNRPQAITPATMFGIASITKTFVAAGIAKLVDAGTLDWDDPVVRHLPEFRTADPYVSTHVTIRDLLSHRSGIDARGDWLEEIPGLSEADLVARLAHTGQSTPFRTKPEYNNYGFVVLAQIIERKTGMPWGRYLTEQIWRPLGMTSTYAHADDFVAARNILPSGDGWSDTVPSGQDAVSAKVDVASPHVQWEAYYKGQIVYDSRELANRTAHFHHTAIDPAQSVFSSVQDMARWAKLLMRATDGPVLSARAIRALRQLNAVGGDGDWLVNGEKPKLRQIGYGLGMEMYRYRGRMLFGHSGGELGFGSQMIVDPEAKVAIVVLFNNLTRTFVANDAIVQYLLDDLYGLPPTDWSTQLLEKGREDHREYQRMFAAMDAERPRGAPLSAPPANYVGRYSDAFGGDIDIVRRGERLFATTGPSYEIELTHWGKDSFRGVVISPLRLAAFLQFDMNEQRQPIALSLQYVEIPEISLRFVRAPVPVQGQ